jgi:hypothetical protein
MSGSSLSQFKTQNECQSSLERNVGTFSYTRPVGCAYYGNNLLRVRIMNALYGGMNYTCIAETTGAEAEKIGMRYGPAIGPVPTDPNPTWHCIDSPRNLQTLKGPAHSAPPLYR